MNALVALEDTISDPTNPWAVPVVDGNTRLAILRELMTRQPTEFQARLQKRANESAQVYPADTPTRHTEENEVKVIDLPIFKPLPGTSQSFAALQEWEGVVTGIENDTVFASLVDITHGGVTLDEVAEIPIGEIAESDLQLLACGAIFRWVIGYLRNQAGTKMRGSIIYFRRGARPPERSAEVKFAAGA